MFPMNDVFGYHVPMRTLYQQMLAHGDPPTWTPALFAGFDLHGEGQIGAYHPLHQLLHRALPLDLALNLEILFTYVSVVAGMRWLLRRLGFAEHAALAGAMTFGLGGFMLTHYPHVNMLAVVAHLPWVLGCFDVLVSDAGRGRRAFAFAASALLVGSQVLLGFPQAIWWTVLAAGAFVIWRARQARVSLWRAIAAPACAGAIGLSIGGIQLLPTLAATAGSVRIHESRSFLLGYSLHPWNVVQLWSPFALKSGAFSRLDRLQFHEFALYPTTFLVLAPIWVWVRRGALERRRPLIVATTAFAAVMFVLALGRYGGLATLLLYLPGIGSFRAPARYIVLMQLALAILGAVALEDLARIGTDGVPLSGRQIAAVASVSVLSVLTLLLLNTGLIPVAPDVVFADVAHAAVGTSIVIAGTALVLLAARGGRWAVPVLVVFTAADLAYWGMSYIYRAPPVPLSQFRMHIPVNAGPEPLRLAGPNNWGDVPLMSGYQMVGGYVGLYPDVKLSWLEDPFRRLAGARRGFDKNLNLVEYTDGVPRARMLTDVRVSMDPAADIQRIDLARTALVDTALPPLGGAPGAAGMLVDRPGHFLVHTEADGRQLLSLSERFDAGWTAAIDGRMASAIPVNGDFLGVVLDAGSHLVELRYQPKAFARGRVTSIAGIVALAAGVLMMLRGSP